MSTTNIVEKPVSRRIEEERTRRRRREDITFGRMRNLAIEGDLDPRYVYRWINDSPGRIHNLTKRDDWDVVTTDMLQDRHEKDRGVGSNVERIASKSDGMRCVLVRKLKDYYNEDKAREQSALDEIDAALKRGETRSPEGLAGPNAYIPSGGISIQDGRKG